MNNKYTLKDARNYATAVERLTRVQDIDLLAIGQALETLANAGDEENFRRVVDSYVRCSATGDAETYTAHVKKEPLAVLEWLCMGRDHGFSEVGYLTWLAEREIATGQIQSGTERRPPVDQTQGFFNELYGKHF
jgi:hypothetical protein